MIDISDVLRRLAEWTRSRGEGRDLLLRLARAIDGQVDLDDVPVRFWRLPAGLPQVRSRP